MLSSKIIQWNKSCNQQQGKLLLVQIQIRYSCGFHFCRHHSLSWLTRFVQQRFLYSSVCVLWSCSWTHHNPFVSYTCWQISCTIKGIFISVLFCSIWFYMVERTNCHVLQHRLWVNICKRGNGPHKLTEVPALISENRRLKGSNERKGAKWNLGKPSVPPTKCMCTWQHQSLSHLLPNKRRLHKSFPWLQNRQPFHAIEVLQKRKWTLPHDNGLQK